MSLSIGGFHPGYTHPGPMGVSTAHDFYSQYQHAHYPDYNDRNYFQNWVFGGAQEMPMPVSPESYASSTPSPNHVTTMYPPQTYVQPVDYVIGENGTLKPWQDLTPSQMAQYEPYTNSFGERCYRRRTTANKKERRRTLSINTAFSNLRGSIPNVPSDTKLSKIKTLRLAISYISYLNEVLENGDSKGGFKADISRKRERRTEQKPADSCVSIKSFTVIMPNGLSHSYQFNESISVLRGVGWYILFKF